MTDLPVKIGNIEVKTELTKDDLITVVVAEYEQRLRTRRKEIETRKKDLKAETKKLRKELDDYCDQLVEAHLLGAKENAVSATKAMKEIGFDVKITSRCSYEHPNPFESRGRQKEEIFVQCSVDIKTKNNGRVSRSDRIRLNDDPKAIKLVTQIRQLLETIDGENDALVEVRRELSDLSSKERQARAQLVSNVLSKDEQGKALLDQLKGKDGTPLLDMTI